VYESFESLRVAKTGVVQMPKRKERLLGGHAVLAVGYNDEKKRFLVCNS
jgi:C1A family cysteine protease